MTGRDRRLQRVGSEGAAQRLRALERGQPAVDQQLVPAAAVLREQQDRLALGIDARGGARGLNLHQRDEPVHLGFGGQQLGENAAEPQRLLAQRRAHPVLAAGGGVALVEDQIDHLEHRGDACGSLLGARHLERHARFGERALGAHDPLRDRRFGHQKRARDLRGTEPAQHAQRQRGARFGR